MIDFNATEEGSIVSKVVREEYEGFIERLKARLNMLSLTDLADIETSNYKDDIRSILGQIPGSKYRQNCSQFHEETQPLESVLQRELCSKSFWIKESRDDGYDLLHIFNFQESQRPMITSQKL